MMRSARDTVDFLFSQLDAAISEYEEEVLWCRSLMDSMSHDSIVLVLEKDQNSLNKLMFYIFERRFGWPESMGKSDLNILRSLNILLTRSFSRTK
jgi:hypothetical protein